MNLYKSLIFILYLGIFLGSGFRTPAQSRDSITLYGTLDTVQVIRQRIQHANEANAGARVTHISPAILQANKTRSLAELLTDHTSIYIIIDSFFPWNQRFPNTGKLERDQYHTSFIGYFRFFTDPGLFYR